MTSLFLAPHSDDEVLFGAFTLMREKPLVVIITDSYIQESRGDKITAFQRWEETRQAMTLLGCPVIRLGIRDDIIDEWEVENKLSRFANFDTVYAPAIQGGNTHHDIVGKVAQKLFNNLKQYTTYTPVELWTKGSVEVTPTAEELQLKLKAMACYKSQIELPATAPHFKAVEGRSEWYL
jgi:LmbE family N-acetylglucosaminyl deacetylase